MGSLFGALDTAVSGLGAQSAAFGNISDNIANSQSNGFKRTDTSFADYLSTSNATTNDSGAVIARPEYQNETEGTISASSDPLALAIGGQGFFQVSQQTGSGASATLSSKVEYSRSGDFTLNNNGYLINGQQQVLDGWVADPTGALDKSRQVPIKIDPSASSPVATGKITLAANLPATPAAGVPITSQVDVYDAKGTLHTVALNFTKSATVQDGWTVSFNAPDALTPALGSADMQFGSATSPNTQTAGTIDNITAGSGTTVSPFTSGSPATIGFSADFGSGPQAFTLDLGKFGAPAGLTQFAGTAYAPESLSQDGVPPGNYTGVTTQSNGNVVVSYDNGVSKIVAKVPVIQFADANALQRQNGQGFTATIDSGAALAQDVSAGGGASLIAGSVEGSNVDIASEFTKLIVAQQAYAANSKVITTANDMLTQTIDMKR